MRRMMLVTLMIAASVVPAGGTAHALGTACTLSPVQEYCSYISGAHSGALVVEEALAGEWELKIDGQPQFVFGNGPVPTVTTFPSHPGAHIELFAINPSIFLAAVAADLT